MKRTMILALALFGTTAACAARHTETPDAESAALAEDGSDSSATESDAETLTESLLTTASSQVGLASVDASGSLHAEGNGTPVASVFFQPAGCLTAVKEAGKTTYTFDGCTGPLGLRKLNGSMDVTWSRLGTDGLHLDIVGAGMKMNGASFAWTATADITRSGAQRSMHWVGTFNGTTARGKTIARSNDKTISWTIGERCLTVDGVSQGQVADRGLRIVVDSFRRCTGSCPDAGSQITITHAATGRTVSITYEGGAAATFTGANGRTSEITLLCNDS
jgi:hypothetical protein